MMHINWKQMERMEGMRVASEILAHLPELSLTTSALRVRQAKLSFYQHFQFYELTDSSQNPPASLYALHVPGRPDDEATLVLDGTNRPIYTANEWAPLHLDAGNITSYIGFFFACVVGMHGPMSVIEKLEDLSSEQISQQAANRGASEDERQDLKDRVHQLQQMCPPRVLDVNAHGIYTIAAAMLFQNCIFRTKMEITPQGIMNIIEHELMVDNMSSVDEAG